MFKKDSFLVTEDANDILTMPELEFKAYKRTTEADGISMPDRQAIIAEADSGERQIFGLVSSRYDLVHHKDVLSRYFDSLALMGGEVDNAEHKMSLYKNGARFELETRLRGISVDVEGESINPSIIFGHGMDGWKGLSFELGAYRMRCSNGMVIGKTFSESKVKHLNELRVNEVMASAEKSVKVFTEDLVPFWTALAEFDMKVEAGDKFIDDAQMDLKLPKRFSDEVRDEWNSGRSRVTGGRNAWGLYNSFTSVITHKTEEKAVERRKELGLAIAKPFQELVLA